MISAAQPHSELERRLGLFDLTETNGPSKVMPLAQAIRTFVRPQMGLHVCWSDARPNGALMEIVRQFAGTDPKFVFSGIGFANSQAALVAAGLVRRLITAYAGESYPGGGVNALFKRAIDAGDIEIENWSQWTLVQRLMAGALGLPFMPTRSLAGSSLPGALGAQGYGQATDPFTGASVGVVAALTPDLAILQGLAADTAGNVVMSPPYGESHWGALAAAGGVIACVERVVSAEEIRAHAGLVRIPAHVVRAVCEVPSGSHPYGSFSGSFTAVKSYVEDADFIAMVARACKSEAGIRAWLDDWVFGVGDHQGYLDKLGTARRDELEAAANPLRWRAELEHSPAAPVGYTPEEAMIVVSARIIAERVQAGKAEVILAGIGASNVACWLADRKLRDAGLDVPLISEIGIYGYAPRPGEPFVFSNRNIATARLLTDVSLTLGTLVSGAHNHCLGAIGAAVIDQFGNVGSTYDQAGGFLVGSGGANDIASAAQEMVITVKHGAARLVPETRHVTSPGRAVRRVVTSRVILERDSADAPLMLAAVIADDDVSTAAAVEAAVADCGWPLAVADTVRREPPPSPEELELIRLFDPHRTFLGRLAATA